MTNHINGSTPERRRVYNKEKRFKCDDGIHLCPVAFLNSAGECMFKGICKDYNKPAKPNKYGRRYY